jgi:hypothetical protein
LDDDVAAMLERVRMARNETLKETVNEALRRGLKEMSTRRKARTPFRTSVVSLGRCRIGSIDSIADALALAEGDPYK